MMWLFAVLVVLAMGGVAMIASGRGGSMPPAYDDRPDVVLPTDRPIGAQDLRTVRFPLALRGYRMSDVDALLARLATELEDRGDPPAPPGPPTPPGPHEQPGSSGEPPRD